MQDRRDQRFCVWRVLIQVLDAQEAYQLNGQVKADDDTVLQLGMHHYWAQI